MASALKMEFCDWVSRRKLITPEQYRQVQSVCEAEPSRDSGEVLLELGYITPEEYEQTIRHISG
ncbi:hypothetical protein JXA32_17375, partial [Candidatus Sumerlaeota bacterium]|nr:hypothetical protein [Candidatus Sumerlaeota bacterium]